MKKLSIVIVTYNSLNDIINCIDSIYITNDLLVNEIEIIIVDNSSIEVFTEMQMLVCKRFENIRLIHNPSNGGYGQGNNVGIKASNAKIICVANPDIIIQNPMFKKVLKSFHSNKKLSVIGGKQMGGINLSFWIRPEFEFFLLTTPLMIVLNKLNVYFEKFCFISGALLFIDKEKFDRIGLFDENIFLYREESDIVKRFLKANYTTQFDKELIYKHLIDDRNKVNEFAFNEEMKSTYYYMKKYNFSFRYFIFQRLLYCYIMKYFYFLTLKKAKYLEVNKIIRKFKNFNF
ncbi:glycosyltransferase [Chryseobacterium nematophagum]|uniref:Glycosyltransferase n=1 Tax=Chryseobacterium nematophagum TaxID=2305228 RepID=A0A3M7L9A2_9FLAO|nr:glycosyltransferase [Chryseobacterium nematophagum]RMZ59323.1 glycosyltransferase [Chryseobacterium nematophagum]